MLRLGRPDHGVPIRFGLGNNGVALDLGNAWFAEGFEVSLIIANVPNGEADDA